MDGIASTTTVDLSMSLQSAQQSRVDEHDKAVDVAKKFEALLLFTMMKSMRASLSEDPLTGSEQQDMYLEMMDREIAESIAKAGGLGMQSMLEEQLSPTPAAATALQDSSKIDATLKPLTASTHSADRTAVSLDFLTRQRLQPIAVID